MKPQKILFLALIVLTLLMAVGCGNKTETAKASNTAEVAESEQVTIPQERPQLIGKIEDVVGNEVTVYKAEMSEGAAETRGESSPNNSGSGQPKPMALNFTEETVTITIPAGTQIAGGGRKAAKPMEITDLKAEQTIMVWQRDDTVTFVQVMGGNGTAANNKQNQDQMQGPHAGGPPAGGQMIIRGGGNKQP